MESTSHDLHRHDLEPRVARVEAALESVTANINALTNDVRSLGDVMREQGAGVERQLQALSVGIAEANAPRRTDWGTLIAAGALVLALGSAVLMPIYSSMGEMSAKLATLSTTLDRHRMLKLHPVGEARIDALEQGLRTRSADNLKQIDRLAEQIDALRMSFAKMEAERK